jgi:AcrR family transcriptional regulator
MKKHKDKTKRSDVQEKILYVACQLIIEKGIKETSLKDIAETVGISKGTLYYYYSAKEDLIADIADSHLNVITTEIFDWIEEIDNKLPPEEILNGVFEKILVAETRGKLNLYLVGSAITNNDLLKERYKERYNEWQRNIKMGLDQIYTENQENHEEMSYLILAVLDGLIIQRLLGFVDIPMAKIVHLVSKMK